MKTIWKYPFEITDEFDLNMSRGAEILSVAYQHTRPTLWVLVDSEAEVQVRKFRVIGTGHPIEDDNSLIYLGTIQDPNIGLVWHLCEMEMS